MTKETASDFVAAVHNIPAWRSKIAASGMFTDEELDMIDRAADDRDRVISELRKSWKATLSKKVADARREIMEDEPSWCAERRRIYLSDKATELAERVRQGYAEAERMAATEVDLPIRLIHLDRLIETERSLKKILRELQARRDKAQPGISERDLEIARAADIADVCEPDKNMMIMCPKHDGQKPHMWVKGGFGYCFSCGAHLDAIGYLMTKGHSFKSAVEYLVGRAR